jgi:hypothetical protein
MTRTRREFLREIGCGALTTTALLTGSHHLLAMNALAAPANDYKALVCVFLFGGNDANNTVVPLDGHADYAAVRGPLTLAKDVLLPINVPSHGASFGLHPNLGRLHALWGAGQLAVVTNVGPLTAPLTREQYRGNGGPKPYQLFSHSDQQAEHIGGDAELAKDLAMHIAASKPESLDATGVPADLLETERRIAIEKAREAGKPEAMLDKIAEGTVQKYLREVTLLGQVFVKAEDGKQTIEQLLKANGASVKEFVLYVVGKGIEKKQADFAAEVAAMAATRA